MKRHEYSGIRTEEVEVSTNGGLYHLARNAVLLSDDQGFSESSLARGNAYRIDGIMQAASQCLYLEGRASTVSIGKTGDITGRDGVRLAGPGAQASNLGTITANYDGIVASGDHSRIENNGTISARDAVTAGGDDTTVVNGEHGILLGSKTGIYALGVSEETLHVINHGRILATGWSLYGGASNDILRNSGRMVGDIFLGDGHDSVNLVGGSVEGTISGGPGDDRLIVDDARYRLLESADEGVDLVASSVSYTLDDNVEVLFLMGKGNVAAIGNGGANVLAGNEGNNRIRGGGGHDQMSGFAGNDRLYGGEGADVFVFEKHHGLDRIEDFVQGSDRIYLDPWLPDASFRDILSHTHNVDGNAVITVGDDRIVVLGTAKAELTAEDFDISNVALQAGAGFEWL